MASSQFCNFLEAYISGGKIIGTFGFLDFSSYLRKESVVSTEFVHKYA